MWDDVVCSYKDSEGEDNIISEDEDLKDAKIYQATK